MGNFLKSAAIILPTLFAPAAAANDEILEFQIEGGLGYLLAGNYGVTSVDVTAQGFRTNVVIGIDRFVSNFSDVMWDAAARASVMSHAPVLLEAVSKPFSTSPGKRVCYLRARKGQVFDGTC